MKDYRQARKYGGEFRTKEVPSNFARAQAGKAMAQPTAAGRAKGDALGLFMNAWKAGTIYAYKKLAANRDMSEILALRGQIDPMMAKHGGVLIARYTINWPDGAGNDIMKYAGLQVVSGGATSFDAMRALEKKGQPKQECMDLGGRSYCAPKGTMKKIKSDGVCTADNPTGERAKVRREATMSALPEGYNMGYGARLGRLLSEALNKNPTNAPSGMVLHNLTISRHLFFVSEAEWKKLMSSGGLVRP